MDDWARFIALYLGKHIAGSPTVVVQNMPGAGTIIAANHVYNIAKPDGLTLGLVNPAVYIDQLLRATEVKFDWPKFSYIGSPERIDQVCLSRRRPLQNFRRYSKGGRAAQVRRSSTHHSQLFFPKLIEEVSVSRLLLSPATVAAVK